MKILLLICYSSDFSLYLLFQKKYFKSLYELIVQKFYILCKGDFSSLEPPECAKLCTKQPPRVYRSIITFRTLCGSHIALRRDPTLKELRCDPIFIACPPGVSKTITSPSKSWSKTVCVSLAFTRLVRMKTCWSTCPTPAGRRLLPLPPARRTPPVARAEVFPRTYVPTTRLPSRICQAVGCAWSNRPNQLLASTKASRSSWIPVTPA